MFFEVAATVALWGLMLTASRRLRPSWLSPGVKRLVSRPAVAIVLIGCLGGLTSAALGLARGLPIPKVHDEFAYLLAGETYALGRLTNPPHPFWRHFEAMHIIQQPTRMSKYPPGQGVVLALGDWAAGEPVAGVWLSLGLASAAIAWMLLAWLPPRWALLGAACVALRLAGTYWSASYWGGAAAAIGGALLLGSVRRLADRADWRTSILFGTGLVILANTRPYEGLVLSVAAVTGLLLAWRRRKAPWRYAELLRAAAPAAAVLLAGAALMGVSNRAVTGSVWRMPYRAHDEQYAGCPTFLLQPLHDPPAYRHADMKRYYAGWERERFLRRRTWTGFAASLVDKLRTFLVFFVGLASLGPYLLMAPIPAGYWRRVAWLSVWASLLAMTQTLYLLPHYLAPITGLVWYLVVEGARRLSVCRVRGHRQPALVTALLLTSGIGPLTGALATPRLMTERARLAERLLEEPGRDLVLLEFSVDYDMHESWVYNAADLDDSPIVWARSLGVEEDRQLQDYFADRRVWRVYVDYRTAVVESEGAGANDRRVPSAAAAQ